VDGITTGVDSLVHKEYRPNGILIEGITKQITNDYNKKGESRSGDIFDMGLGLIGDGLSGYGAGKIVGENLGKFKGKTGGKVKGVRKAGGKVRKTGKIKNKPKHKPV
jgi:hypothetical protein